MIAAAPVRATRALAVALLLLLATGCAAPAQDRFEAVNRPVQHFNDGLDRTVTRPLARGWVAAVPAVVRARVGAVFANLREPLTIVNQFLQGKPVTGARDGLRFLVNTTAGIGGLFDVATGLGLDRHEEDFGQTFAVWGLPPGDWLVVPVRGGVTARDAVGDLLGLWLYAPLWLGEGQHRIAATVLDVVDTRAALLGAEPLVHGDRYRFLRDATLQRRAHQVRDGAVEDPFLDGP